MDDYNSLIKLKKTFDDVGKGFKIWLDDGTFNKDDIIKTIENTVNSFRDRYKDNI